MYGKITIYLALLALPLFTGCTSTSKSSEMAKRDVAKNEANHKLNQGHPPTETSWNNNICPIMKEGPVDVRWHTQYRRKTVYFCCKGCIKMFKKNPEKYTAVLMKNVRNNERKKGEKK